MKREIKFRSVWYNMKDDTFSHFSYWGFLNHRDEYDKDCFKAPGSSSHHYRKDENQFTGLPDKNGKEIYEGDIVQLIYGRYIVEFITELGLFSICRPIGKVASYPFIDYDRSEVIGNIYENPKLLDAN